MDDVRPVQAATSESGAAIAEAGAQGGVEEKGAGKVEEFTKKINLPILEATLTEKELYNRCLAARAHGIGAVIVRPCDVDSALRFVGMGSVKVASVIGYPWGGNSTGVKLYECRDLLRRGVRELYAFPNPGKMISRQFQHQEVEFIQFADDCLAAGATLKIVVDNTLLDDEMKIITCRMAKRVNAHYIASTEPRDLELLLKHCGDRALLEAGGIQSYAQARMALDLGCRHVSSAGSVAILDTMVMEFEAQQKRPT